MSEHTSKFNDMLTLSDCSFEWDILKRNLLKFRREHLQGNGEGEDCVDTSMSQLQGSRSRAEPRPSPSSQVSWDQRSPSPGGWSIVGNRDGDNDVDVETAWTFMSKNGCYTPQHSEMSGCALGMRACGANFQITAPDSIEDNQALPQDQGHAVALLKHENAILRARNKLLEIELQKAVRSKNDERTMKELATIQREETSLNGRLLQVEGQFSGTSIIAENLNKQAYQLFDKLKVHTDKKIEELKTELYQCQRHNNYRDKFTETQQNKATTTTSASSDAPFHRRFLPKTVVRYRSLDFSEGRCWRPLNDNIQSQSAVTQSSATNHCPIPSRSICQRSPNPCLFGSDAKGQQISSDKYPTETNALSPIFPLSMRRNMKARWRVREARASKESEAAQLSLLRHENSTPPAPKDSAELKENEW